MEFKLPDLGEGLHEAEILNILVKEGDIVKEDQPIFEVETDKAVATIDAPCTGKVTNILVKVGEIAKVGNVIITFDTSGGAAGQEDKTAAASKTSAAAVSSSIKPASAPADRQAAAAAGGNGDRNYQHAAAPATHKGPVAAAPATRRLAREMDVDLKMIQGTGPGGRILKEDLRAYAEGVPGSVRGAGQPAAGAGKAPAGKPHTAPATGGGPGARHTTPTRRDEPAEPFTPTPMSLTPYEMPDFSKFGPVERAPLRSLRRKIANNMALSWAHVPHVTSFDEVDITDIETYRQKHEKSVAERGGKLTLTVLAMKALVAALRLYPQFNSSLDEATSEIVYKHYYNIGIAVATERGLIVPVIKDADQKSVVDLSIELAEIAQKTREGKIEVDRLQGGTFTITNIGAIGGTGMVPMVNYPECAILGMARAQEKPVVRHGEIVIRTMLNVALSFDHRIADGAEAAYFVRHFAECLSDPFKLLMEV
jgi:pyruvate dehydrogenase E2 component (dihydrolipoamide acetyltransferase)